MQQYCAKKHIKNTIITIIFMDKKNYVVLEVINPIETIVCITALCNCFISWCLNMKS